MNLRYLIFGTCLVSQALAAAEPDEAEDSSAEQEPTAELTASQANSGPKTMSGMSILGNEEAPKALVIVPWKSSELGDDISLTDSLDDRARPVDRDVFARELHFYEIRTAR